jgi:hypothetical protein
VAQALACVSGIPVLFFHAQKVALIESMNPQWHDLERRVKERGKEPGFYARHANDSLKKRITPSSAVHWRARLICCACSRYTWPDGGGRIHFLDGSGETGGVEYHHQLAH